MTGVEGTSRRPPSATMGETFERKACVAVV